MSSLVKPGILIASKMAILSPLPSLARFSDIFHFRVLQLMIQLMTAHCAQVVCKMHLNEFFNDDSNYPPIIPLWIFLCDSNSKLLLYNKPGASDVRLQLLNNGEDMIYAAFHDYSKRPL